MPFKSKATLALEAAQNTGDAPSTPDIAYWKSDPPRREYKVVEFLHGADVETALNTLDRDFGFLFVVPSNAPHTDGYAVFVREVRDVG